MYISSPSSAESSRAATASIASFTATSRASASARRQQHQQRLTQQDSPLVVTDDDDDLSTSAAPDHVHSKPTPLATTITSKSNSKSNGQQEEIFLRNPRTGGFDYTPEYQQQERHEAAAAAAAIQRMRGPNASTTGRGRGRSSYHSYYQRKQRHHVIKEEAYYDVDEDTLADSDVYTSIPAAAVVGKAHQIVSNNNNQKKTKKNQHQQPRSSRKTYFSKSSKNNNNNNHNNSGSNDMIQPNSTKTTIATKYHSPELQEADTPSPRKRKSIRYKLQKLKCKMAASPPSKIIINGGTTAAATTKATTVARAVSCEDDDEDSNEDWREQIARDVASARARARQPTSSTATAATTTAQTNSILVTPPRSGRSPRKSSINSTQSLMDQIDEEEELNDHTNLQQQQQSSNSATSTSSTSTSLSLGNPTPLTPLSFRVEEEEQQETINPSSSSTSSCLDFSFTALNTSKEQERNKKSNNKNAATITTPNKNLNDSVWTFEAVSPVLNCGRDTTTPTPHNNANDDSDSMTMDISCNLFQDHSGFEADNDETTNTNDVSIMNPESLSFTSPGAGAVLLTEEGLKRHNDQKLQRLINDNDNDDDSTLAFLELRTKDNGAAGKLEKVVLKQKVRRLQAKELKQQADTFLEQARAERRRQLKKEKQHEPVHNVEDDDQVSTSLLSQKHGKSSNKTGPKQYDKLRSPVKTPRTPVSTSPQTSTGVQTPGSHEKQQQQQLSKKVVTLVVATKPARWFKRVLHLKKKKKPTAEELKLQWREKERQRVELARLEKEEAERRERERIEALRQSYLEKQRQLEVTAAIARPRQLQDGGSPASTTSSSPSKHSVIVDVDDLIAANYNASHQSNLETHPYEDDDVLAALSSTSNSTNPSSTVSDNSDLREHCGRTRTKASVSTKPATMTTAAGVGTCTVCHIRERSHISMPCMHFAFCENCVRNQNVCPLCSRENVVFSFVNTQ